MKSAARESDVERVVVDTSVLVSAAFGGKPFLALERARRHRLLLSDEIAAEVLDVLSRLRPKLGAAIHDRLRQLAEQVLQAAERVVVMQRLKVCRDPNDDIFLEACLAGQATVLLTGDDDLLSLTDKDLKAVNLAKLRILSPAAWLEEQE
ncbi:MAG: putative toxin-antitoxin system toxin component, PIN family [Candidatus Wallbacteria bacterium]|nr:putative toxin-antitoxin system toxin component, PIN family [Candidatus Wallbacteria bacterium]